MRRIGLWRNRDLSRVSTDSLVSGYGASIQFASMTSHRGPRHQRVVPADEVGEILEVEIVALVPPGQRGAKSATEFSATEFRSAGLLSKS